LASTRRKKGIDRKKPLDTLYCIPYTVIQLVCFVWFRSLPSHPILHPKSLA
jgi:hypothetical protein